MRSIEGSCVKVLRYSRENFTPFLTLSHRLCLHYHTRINMAAYNCYAGKNTSLITILPSAHGQLHSEQRDIDKQNLQWALKYGRFQRDKNNEKWLIEYDGIIFVMDRDRRQEQTIHPTPLPMAEIDFMALEANNKTNFLFAQKPKLSTSHSVIMIDNSGSVLSKKNDVLLYHDSPQHAACSFTALEVIAEQLFSNTAVNSDLVLLIKFREHPSVDFLREPTSWFVYTIVLAH